MIHAPMMRLVLLLATVASVSCANDRPVWASQGVQDDPAELKHAGELERSGKYDEATAIYRTLAAKDGPTTVESRRGLLRTLSEVGKYADAETAGKGFLAGPFGVQLQNSLGEVLRLRGKTAEAEAAFRAATAGHASDSLTARLNLDVLRYDRGEHAEALRDLDDFIDIYNTHKATLKSDELVAVGTACQYLGVTNPQLFKDALKAYDEAKWAELPKSHQAMLQAACSYALTEMLAGYDARNARAIARVVAQGAVLTVLTPETLRALRTALEQVLDEEAAKSAQFKTVLDNWRAFRAEQHRWFSIADARTEMSVYALTAAGTQ